MSDVKVFARFRPLNARELKYYEAHPDKVHRTYKMKPGSSNTIEVVKPKRETVLGEEVDQQLDVGEDAQRRDFSFDAILDENVTQEHVYETLAKPLVDDVLQGFNATIMAYGQTGCLDPDTPVRVFYSPSDSQVMLTKRVRDVVVGDVLVGDDAKPRVVQRLFSGSQEMYDVSSGASSYRVNEDHVLTLWYSPEPATRWHPEDRSFRVHYFQEGQAKVKTFRVARNSSRGDGFDVLDTEFEQEVQRKALDFEQRALSFDRTLDIKVSDYLKRPREWQNLFRGIRVQLGVSGHRMVVTSTEYYSFEVSPAGRGPYQGFMLDGNHRFVLGDGTVTHNSGKTHSMMGGSSSEMEGIIPRMMKDLFQRVEDRKDRVSTVVQCSYVEIYLEKVRDLLDPSRDNLKLREVVSKTFSKKTKKTKATKSYVYIEDCTVCTVRTVKDMMKVMRKGQSHRMVASTEMNHHSSRSHSVFVVNVVQTNIAKQTRKCSKVFLVDLAGSENVGRSKATGLTLEQASQINKSLSALSLVISALVDKRKRHVPYRDSKLTRLLTDSLGGNSKTVLLLALSPSFDSLRETYSTLGFGTRAKKVENCARINEDISISTYKKMVLDLREELEQWKLKHQVLLGRHGVLRDRYLSLREKYELLVELLGGEEKVPESARVTWSEEDMETREREPFRCEGGQEPASPGESTSSAGQCDNSGSISIRKRSPVVSLPLGYEEPDESLDPVPFVRGRGGGGGRSGRGRKTGSGPGLGAGHSRIPSTISESTSIRSVVQNIQDAEEDVYGPDDVVEVTIKRAVDDDDDDDHENGGVSTSPEEKSALDLMNQMIREYEQTEASAGGQEQVETEEEEEEEERLLHRRSSRPDLTRKDSSSSVMDDLSMFQTGNLVVWGLDNMFTFESF